MAYYKKIILGAIIISGVLLAGGIIYAASQGFNVTFEVSSPVSAYIKWAIPEGRVGAAGTNWDTMFYIKVKTADGSATLYTQPTLVTSDTWGRYNTLIDLSSVGAGTYDIYIKGHHSLTKKMDDITLAEGQNRLNFTQPDNSTATGTVRLLAGDISGATSSPALMGDDVINAVDLNIMLDHLDETDPTTRDIRANVNQDPEINSVDLSLLLNNLDQEGDQ